ncbi:MAG: hypothetical protein JW913_02905 [Chitinispirillaceae bacterium]|nr:hypothetical protein [Chitinispirillaceae bacterium]
MMRLFDMKLLTVYALAAGVGLFRCTPVDQAGGTEYPPGYVGTLYQENGSVAANAIVRFIKDEPRDGGKEIARVTNDNGYIIIDDTVLEDGVYYAFGENENGDLKSFTDSILFDDGSCSPLTITLKKTGSLTGKIQLRYASDPLEEVSIYFFSTQKQRYIVDKDGMFTISDLAEGSYRVRFDIKIDEYHPFDTIITIRSGCRDTMPLPVKLMYRIEIDTFWYTMDTLMRSVTLFWERIDSTAIGGYKLETIDGVQQLYQVLLKDTSITIYLKNFLGARVSTYDPISNKEMGNFTDWIYITAKDIAAIKTIALPADSVRTKGWGFINNQFHVVRTSFYDKTKVSISVHEKDGKLVTTRFLNGLAKDSSTVLSVASKGDSLYILEKKNDDTLCIRAINPEDSLIRSANITIPSNFGSGANLAFGSNGMVYVSQFRTTYVFDEDGVLKYQQDGLATHFGISGNGLFTSVDGAPLNVAKFEFQDNGSLALANTFVYDKYGLIVNTDPRAFAANNKGIICCLIELSLFVFDEQETFKARLHIENAPEVVDLLLTDDNYLYLLYVTGRIDVINLAGITSRVK